jgi:hypothetical protein
VPGGTVVKTRLICSNFSSDASSPVTSSSPNTAAYKPSTPSGLIICFPSSIVDILRMCGEGSGFDDKTPPNAAIACAGGKLVLMMISGKVKRARITYIDTRRRVTSRSGSCATIDPMASDFGSQPNARHVLRRSTR